jgi:hypothetical protein
MKSLTKTLLKGATYLAFTASVATVSMAQAETEKPATQPKVTVETTDKVLLEGKKFSQIAKVKEPTEDLELEIEGIKHSISIAFENGETVLVVPAQSKDSKEVIRETFMALSGDKNVSVKVVGE